MRAITRSSGSFASRLSSSSDRPSAKYSWSLLAAHVRERQHRDGLGRCLDRCLRRRRSWRCIGCGRDGRCAWNEPLDGHDDDRDDEQSDDDEVELAGRLCRDRGVALDLVLALQAFRCQLVDPGEDERRHEAQHSSPANSSLFAPGRQPEQAEQQLADLQEHPGCDEVQRRHSEDVATLQLRDYGHVPTPGAHIGSAYYVTVPAGSGQLLPFVQPRYADVSTHAPASTNASPLNRPPCAPYGASFSTSTKAVMAPIHSRLITPPTNSRSISAQQQPTQ